MFSLVVSLNRRSFYISLKSNFILIFALTVIVVRVSIAIYRSYYIVTSVGIKFFWLVKGIFVLSILTLLSNGSLFMLFIGWDGLGVSSYFLVVYYNNWKSQSAGIITILTNRTGDVCLFLIFVLSIWIFSFVRQSFTVDFVLGLFVIMCFTKSAQTPFSSWLPFAIAAPTPISSLVHSSTLVTAGVVVIIQLVIFWTSVKLILFVIIISVLTLNFSGILSMFEKDLKKIVALSTLNQLSFIFLILRFNMKYLAFFHLNTHAIFKSLLFMNVGIIIHSVYRIQDKRGYGLIINRLKLVTLSTFISRFNLIGGIFTAGFFSKDLVVEHIIQDRKAYIFSIFFVTSLIYTFLYTLRIFVCVISASNVAYSCGSVVINSIIPIIGLSVLSLLGGKLFFQHIFRFCVIILISSGKVLIQTLLFIIFSLFLNKNKYLCIFRAYLANFFYIDYRAIGVKHIKNWILNIIFIEKIIWSSNLYSFSFSIVSSSRFILSSSIWAVISFFILSIIY